MTPNINGLTPEILLDNFRKMTMYAYMMNRIGQLYLIDMLPAKLDELMKLDNTLFIPIMDEDLIAKLRLFDEDDWVSFYLLLGEWGSFSCLVLDVTQNTEEYTPKMMKHRTPFLLTITQYKSIIRDDDDGGGDDDDPIGDKTAPLKTMAVSAGSRK